MDARLGSVVPMATCFTAWAVVDAVVGIGTVMAGTGGIVAVVTARFGTSVSRSRARVRATAHFLNTERELCHLVAFMAHFLKEKSSCQSRGQKQRAKGVQRTLKSNRPMEVLL